MRDIERAESSGETILFIHNHPNGTPPSIAGINELLDHKKAVGITVGHNGTIYYYSKPNQKISNFDLDVARRKAKVYNKTEKWEKALEILSGKFEFDFRKL